MKRFFTLAAIAVLAGCSGSSPLAPVDPPAELTEFDAELNVDRAWTRDVGGGTDEQYLKLQPLVAGDQAFAVSRGGRVEAFGAADGEAQWTVELDDIVTTGPGDGGDLLLIGSDADVLALDKADGSVKWRRRVSSEVLAAPLLAAGRVLVHTLDGNLIALDAFDGTERWRFGQPVPTLSLRGSGRPVAVANAAVVGFANGRLAAIDLERGTPLWETAVAAPRGRTELERLVDVDASLVVAGGAVFAASYQGRTVALTLAGGQPFWERDIGSYTGIALADATLYLTDVHGDVWALEARSGATLWKQDALHGRGLTAPTVQGDYLVVGDFEGYLHWLSREDGHLAARNRIGKSSLLTAPEVVGSRVYAVNTGGDFAAFDVEQAGTRKPE